MKRLVRAGCLHLIRASIRTLLLLGLGIVHAAALFEDAPDGLCTLILDAKKFGCLTNLDLVAVGHEVD